MTFAQKKCLLATCVSLAAIGGWVCFRQSCEPRYAGKPLRYWFKEYCRSGHRMTWDAVRHERAVVALRRMGTNAVPCLLEQAFDIGPSRGARIDLCRLVEALPRSWGLRALVSPEIMSAEAAEALKEIRPPAKQVLGLLKPHLKSSNARERNLALYILGNAGEGSEPSGPGRSLEWE